MQKILLYISDDRREREVKNILNENGYSMIESISDIDVNTYVGELFGLEVEKNTNENYESIDGEFMILGNYENEDILNILKIFRENNISRPITCTLTENNCNWKLGELFRDLKLEDEYMKKQNQNK